VWKQHVAAWQGSGLTARQFAARIGVNSNTLAHWKWRLAGEGETVAAAVSFVELRTDMASSGSGGDERLEVVCRGGRTVRVARDFDAGALMRLIEALERA
jgi:hypothetical protein